MGICCTEDDNISSKATEAGEYASPLKRVNNEARIGEHSETIEQFHMRKEDSEKRDERLLVKEQKEEYELPRIPKKGRD